MATICIPLLGKGATNHLHKVELVQAFAARGVRITFLVRRDYEDLLDKLPGCDYVAYDIPEHSGLAGKVLRFLVDLRYMYPSSDPWRKWRHEQICLYTPRLLSRLVLKVLFMAAHFRWVMSAAVAIEGWIYRRTDSFEDLKKINADLFFVLGAGTWADAPSCRIVWHCRALNIPVVNFIANYDGLCSKGYRGVPVDCLLVWGDRMAEDAMGLHAISAERVHQIGALRYNMIDQADIMSRSEFFAHCGLNPDARTIVFAGSSYSFHYFEAVAAFDELKSRAQDPLQLIIRIYPNRQLLKSGYISTLIDYASRRDDVWVSVGDPYYFKRETDDDVIKIDEHELWSMLKHCDVVINIFSTLTLEACIFDKPVINMWYFHHEGRALKQAVFYPYPLTQHIRRVSESGAAVLAEGRSQLVAAVSDALRDRSRLADNRATFVAQECGDLDALAIDRLVDCVMHVV